MTPIEALKRAATIAGSQEKLAAAIGKKQGHVWDWLNKRGQCPAEFAIPIEEATGVSRHQLRPDIYPQDQENKAEIAAA